MFWGWISPKRMKIKTRFEWSTYRKWHIGNRMVTWSMASRDPLRAGWRRCDRLAEIAVCDCLSSFILNPLALINRGHTLRQTERDTRPLSGMCLWMYIEKSLFYDFHKTRLQTFFILFWKFIAFGQSMLVFGNITAIIEYRYQQRPGFLTLAHSTSQSPTSGHHCMQSSTNRKVLRNNHRRMMT